MSEDHKSIGAKGNQIDGGQGSPRPRSERDDRCPGVREIDGGCPAGAIMSQPRVESSGAAGDRSAAACASHVHSENLLGPPSLVASRTRSQIRRLRTFGAATRQPPNSQMVEACPRRTTNPRSQIVKVCPLHGGIPPQFWGADGGGLLLIPFSCFVASTRLSPPPK